MNVLEVGAHVLLDRGVPQGGTETKHIVAEKGGRRNFTDAGNIYWQITRKITDNRRRDELLRTRAAWIYQLHTRYHGDKSLEQIRQRLEGTTSQQKV